MTNETKPQAQSNRHAVRGERGRWTKRIDAPLTLTHEGREKLASLDELTAPPPAASPWNDVLEQHPRRFGLAAVPRSSGHEEYHAPPTAEQIQLADEMHDAAERAAFKIWLREMSAIVGIVIAVALALYFAFQLARPYL